MGKNFSKNQHFADFSACSGHPGFKKRLSTSFHGLENAEHCPNGLYS
jgi:hypothetical protein